MYQLSLTSSRKLHDGNCCDLSAARACIAEHGDSSTAAGEHTLLQPADAGQPHLLILAKSNRNCMRSMMHADTEDDDAA